MEVGVRVIGIILRILNFLLAPVFWLRARDDRRLPPLTDPLLLKSATELAAAIRNGELTSARVVGAYIARLETVNVYLNAVVEARYGPALADARAADRRIAEATRGGTLDALVAAEPLLGVPFTVKESCSLAGLSNAVGCLENAGSRAAADGAAVRLVRAAGAIPLAVTNTPELCLGWETTNLLTGTTVNPYDFNRTPGGSSGGEAALLASGATCFSVASDIAGSIRIPAAFCGVFGHKPTPGVVPIAGHVPTLRDALFPRLLAVGPMARRAADLRPLLRVMAGERSALLALDRPVRLGDLKVYYMLESSKSPVFPPVDPGIADMILRARDHLEKCGATICEEKFIELEDSVEISVSVFFSMKDIPDMLQDPSNPKCGGVWRRRSLQSLCFALLRRSQLLIPRARRTHYARRAAALADTLARTLGDNGVLLYPAWCSPAHRHGAVVSRAAGAALAAVFNVTGAPAATVPAPARPLPLALQVIAAPYQDRLCLAVAEELEKAFGGWQPPQ